MHIASGPSDNLGGGGFGEFQSRGYPLKFRLVRREGSGGRGVGRGGGGGGGAAFRGGWNV